mmetsp:Transcript_58822/g.102950  ORF Transcript_58822/g.102950 Transcript_58822/m.102950 type:complete len:475 (-) Transcript_58822:67-1491(-)
MQQLPGQVGVVVACILRVSSGLHLVDKIVSYDASPALMDHVSFIESERSVSFERHSSSKLLYNDSAGNQSISLIVAHSPSHPVKKIDDQSTTLQSLLDRILGWLSIGRASYRHPQETEHHFDTKFDIHFGFWLAFGIGCTLFWIIHCWIINTYAHNEELAVELIFGLIVVGAVLFDIFVFNTLGVEAGIMWFDGYLQEIIFSMENIFAFFPIVKAFDVPPRLTTKVLFFVVVGQIIFQGLLYLDFSEGLEALIWLPYVLGTWLIYMGVSAILEHEDEHEEQFLPQVSEDKLEKRLIIRLLAFIFGDRMVMNYGEWSFFTRQNGKLSITLLCPVFILLLLTDFFLECDVTLTKIETLSDKYIEWTSSAFAAFALPEFFFVVRYLCDRYFALPYGIAFVLIFFGTELCLSDLVVIPGLLGVAIILTVMISCITVSILLDSKHQKHELAWDHEIDGFHHTPGAALLEEREDSKCVIH